jgi:HTH-type transcriptional regulator/antitoxin HigA
LKAQSLAELPGILIRARIAQGLSQRELAGKLGLKEQQIQRYEAEEYSTANVLRLAEVANALDLNISEVAELRQDSPAKKEPEPEPIHWDRFPIKEMYRRNWFEGYAGTLSGAVAQAEMLMTDLMKRAGSQPRLALHRKRVRSGSSVDLYALLGWQCRVLALANASPPANRFDPERLDDKWFTKLAQQSRCPDGPVRARKYLEAAGISVVIEPHLPSTHLDGAALLGEKGPVIGLTLRYDRLDNFWFVLFHELIHVKIHLKKGRVEDIFDDLDAEADPLEREADELAGRALIANEVWETALARYLRTEDSIKELANELKIGEALIAGRIRKEADNYIILAELVGIGKVRQHFPDVRFGQ